MGVFDGGTYRVDVYRKGEDFPEERHTDHAADYVKHLRMDLTVRAVETFWVHFVIGPYQPDLSFGDLDEED